MIQSTSQTETGVCRTALGLIGIFGTCLKVNFFVIYDPFMSGIPLSECLQKFEIKYAGVNNASTKQNIYLFIHLSVLYWWSICSFFVLDSSES